MTAYTLQGCTVQGYPGPERPDSETALIEVEYSTSDMELQSVTVDGYKARFGVRVLPGTHRLAASASAKDPLTNCSESSSFDAYGYAQCKRKENTFCDCYDYFTVTETCERPLHDSECTGTVVTRAAEKYALSFSTSGGYVTIDVRSSSGSAAGTVSCTNTGYRVETESETSNGRGKGYPYGCW